MSASRPYIRPIATACVPAYEAIQMRIRSELAVLVQMLVLVARNDVPARAVCSTIIAVFSAHAPSVRCPPRW